MKTDGIKKQIIGETTFRQSGNEWIDLAEALEYLEWLEFQRILWAYDCVPSNSPDQEYIN
jgi:hypothetical protein